MDNKTNAVASNKQPLVTEAWLAIQDEHYAKRRLPEPTPAGAEDRTYCFRVEFEHDLYPLSHMLKWATETWWSSPICPWGDADVKVTLKPNPLTLEEIRWLFDHVGDCHVAVETVELEANYTGERTYRTEEELEMKVPSVAALEASLGGLNDYRDALASNDERAADAEAGISAELTKLRRQQHQAGSRLSPESVKPSKPQRSKRATS